MKTKAEYLLKLVASVNLVEIAAVAVERAAATFKAQEGAGVSGLDKRCAAVEMIAGKIRIPFVPRWLVRMAVGGVVDRVVAEMNERAGHDWGRDDGAV